MQRLSKALTAEEFRRPLGDLGLFETDLADVRPIITRERTPTPY